MGTMTDCYVSASPLEVFMFTTTPTPGCPRCNGYGKLYIEHPLKPGVPMASVPCPVCSDTQIEGQANTEDASQAITVQPDIEPSVDKASSGESEP